MRAVRSAGPKDFERSSSNPRSDPAGAQMGKPQVWGAALSEAHQSPLPLPFPLIQIDPTEFNLLDSPISISFPPLSQTPAQVVELVDTHDSGSCAARCGGSSPPLGTKKDKAAFSGLFCD